MPWILILLLLLLPSSKTELSELMPETVQQDRYMMHTKHMETNEVLNNPFIGFVPSATYGDFPYPHRLVYKVLTWSELEPEKGKYDFETIERRYRMDEFFADGVRFIFRIVLDYGTDEVHKDIPDWLYGEIGEDGIWYDAPVGKGFSPNYENDTLQQYHRQLIQAFGDKYNDDPRVAFIALGSLGHWGEWHTYSGQDGHIPFPPMAESDRYVRHYVDAFPDKKLLMRRPYPIARDNGMGLYNDMFGSARQTYDYIEWFEEGYQSSLADAFIPAMSDFHLRGPSGGEFGNAGSGMRYYNAANIEATIAMAERSHLSWVGPSTDIEELSDAEIRNMKRFLNTLGYRFVIRSSTYSALWEAGKETTVGIELDNVGVAPFYYVWPLELSLIDSIGRIAYRTLLDTDIRSLTPGTHTIEQTLTPPSTLPTGTYTIAFAVLDPETGAPGVELAITGKRPDGRYPIGAVLLMGK